MSSATTSTSSSVSTILASLATLRSYLPTYASIRDHLPSTSRFGESFFTATSTFASFASSAKSILPTINDERLRQLGDWTAQTATSGLGAAKWGLERLFTLNGSVLGSVFVASKGGVGEGSGVGTLLGAAGSASNPT